MCFLHCFSRHGNHPARNIMPRTCQELAKSSPRLKCQPENRICRLEGPGHKWVDGGCRPAWRIRIFMRKSSRRGWVAIHPCRPTPHTAHIYVKYRQKTAGGCFHHTQHIFMLNIPKINAGGCFPTHRTYFILMF